MRGGQGTRLCFGDKTEANATGPVLGLIENRARHTTLVAPHETVDGKPVYRLDIRLQGRNETVFFDV